MTALDYAIDRIDAIPRTPENDLAIETAIALMRGYDARWGSSPWRTIEVEQEFQLPIVNPDTERTSRTFTHVGKLDAVAEYEDREFLVEHKTCSEDIADPSSCYWRRLEIDAQVSGYVLSKWQAGRKLAGTLYDVIRKPSIRPKQVGPDKRIETPQEFGERLHADTLERPEFYFARRVIYRDDRSLYEFACELRDVAKEIRIARLEGAHYRNSSACNQFNSPCEYLPLCSGHDVAESDKWEKRKIHSELAMVEHPDAALSHSRIACFKTCRRKHYYRYELGIKRRDSDESKSLYFGRIFHDALAAWWSFGVSDRSSRHDCTSCAPATTEAAGTAVAR